MVSSFSPGPHGFVLARDARALGREHELRAEIEAGALERVRVGVYRRAGEKPRWAHERHAEPARAAAVSLARPVFTAYSAAALFGLPILSRRWPNEIFLLSERATGARRRGVIELGRLAVTALAAVDGLAVTSVELTLIQLGRVAPLPDALAATDAALRVPRHRRDPAPLTTCERVRALHEQLLPYRGSRKVEAVLARSTVLSDSPLETGSRLLIEQHGFEAPVLQHAIALPELGRTAHLDFYWPSVDAAAEADGHGKYLAATAESSAATVIQEKDRENAVRRRVRAFDRWDWSEYRAGQPVVDRLVALGVPRIHPVRIHD